jgi:hypothetical protein
MARNAGNWDQDRFTQTEVADNSRNGYVAGEVDMTPGNIADEAKADRAAGRSTVGTRGYADTEAFDRS